MDSKEPNYLSNSTSSEYKEDEYKNDEYSHKEYHIAFYPNDPNDPNDIKKKVSQLIMDMPTELLHYIFTFLPFDNKSPFSNIELVCKEWYFIVNDPIFWKFQCIKYFESAVTKERLRNPKTNWKKLFYHIMNQWGGLERKTSQRKCKRLVKCCENGKLKQAKKYLALGVDVNYYPSFNHKSSPLFKAVENGNLELVKILLTAGANIERFRDELVEIASRKGKVELADYLKKYNKPRSKMDYLLFRSECKVPRKR